MTALTANLIADDQIQIQAETTSAAQALASVFRGQPDWTEVVAGLDSVTLQFDPLSVRPADALDRAKNTPPATPAKTDINDSAIRIPVRYGEGPISDLKHVAEQTGLSMAEIIALHTKNLYTVEMIGFTPGFAYLSGLDPRLTVPRLPCPRAKVPSGSIGISGGYCGLYALAGPGGWPILGRTDHILFQKHKPSPFVLKPGQTIQFEAARGS